MLLSLFGIILPSILYPQFCDAPVMFIQPKVVFTLLAIWKIMIPV